MAQAFKHIGPVTAREVVALWSAWCLQNELPPPDFTLIDPDDDEFTTLVAVVPLETKA